MLFPALRCHNEEDDLGLDHFETEAYLTDPPRLHLRHVEEDARVIEDAQSRMRSCLEGAVEMVLCGYPGRQHYGGTLGMSQTAV